MPQVFVAVGKEELLELGVALPGELFMEDSLGRSSTVAA